LRESGSIYKITPKQRKFFEKTQMHHTVGDSFNPGLKIESRTPDYVGEDRTPDYVGEDNTTV